MEKHVLKPAKAIGTRWVEHKLLAFTKMIKNWKVIAKDHSNKGEDRANAKGITRLEINEKIQSQFCDTIRKFSHNFANFSRKIATLHCVVSSLAKNMSPQYLCVKKPLKMANDRRNGAVHVTSQLNYSTITLSEKTHSEKQNNFVIYLFIYFSESSSKSGNC